MHRALAQLMLDVHTEQHGYVEMYVPYLVNQDSLYGTGQLPKFGEDLFHTELSNKKFSLIPTAEVPLTNLLRNEIVDESELPIKMCAHTPCFRSGKSYPSITFRRNQCRTEGKAPATSALLITSLPPLRINNSVV